ncbi:MAG TPA: ABC transporter permease [Chitinophagaceae bacterium]|nr:ABC transporter permease [Chitinophagaceae bacterium]
MFKNYLISAWRSITRNKFYTILHIFGMATGLAVGILVLYWVKDELSFDRFNPNGKNIFRVISHLGTGNSQVTLGESPSPLAIFATRDIPGVVHSVRISVDNVYTLFRNGRKSFTGNQAAYVDPALFSMFDFPLIYGNPAKPFTGNHSLILTETTARKFFGNQNPMGRILVANDSTNFVISGVMKDFPENSSIRYDMLMPMSLLARNFLGNGSWKTIDTDLGNFNYQIFIQLQAGISADTVCAQLTRIYKGEKGPEGKGEFFTPQPLLNMHLYGADGNDSAMQAVRIFLMVGLLILAISCINYVNLSTARSLVRAKEVSTRKIIGAARFQLFLQFIIETILLFIMAIAGAIILIILLLPLYNQVSGRQMVFNPEDPGVWKIFILAIAGTLAASALYPAMLMSSFRPVAALRGKFTPGISTYSIRKVLVITQFVISVILITGTLIIGRQLHFIRSRSPGFDRSYVFTMEMNNIGSHYAAIRSQLLQQPGVFGVAGADDNIIHIGSATGDTWWDGKAPGNMFMIHPMGINAQFIPLMKMKMLEGSNFSGSVTDAAHVILNETAVKEAGITDPVGKKFILWQDTGTIIGVVRDFNYASLKQKIEPLIFYDEPQPGILYVKTTGRDAAMALAAARAVWEQYNPSYPFAYRFLDASFDRMYRTDQRMGNLFRFFALVAILLSCLGLYGLATFTTKSRTREIGIRKVIGASVWNIMTLLSGDFIKLVIMAMIIGIPVALLVMNNWLNKFAYHIHPGPGIFLLAGFMVIGIAFLTVSSQGIKAAVANPVKSLRTE